MHVANAYIQSPTAKAGTVARALRHMSDIGLITSEPLTKAPLRLTRSSGRRAWLLGELHDKENADRRLPPGGNTRRKNLILKAGTNDK